MRLGLSVCGYGCNEEKWWEKWSSGVENSVNAKRRRRRRGSRGDY